MGLPAKRDPDADATLALLDQALGLVAQADAATARELRDKADAAVLLARRRRLDDVQRRAAELKLRAEARLGEVLGPALDRVAAAKAGRGEQSPAATAQEEEGGLDKHDIARCRKVAGVKDYISDYLAFVRAAGEDPTRAGLLRYAADMDRRIREAKQHAEERRQLAGPRAKIDSLEDSPTAAAGAALSSSGASGMAATLAGAAGQAKRQAVEDKRRGPAVPVRQAPEPERRACAAVWRSIGADLQAVAAKWAQARPDRLAPEGDRDLREEYWADLGQRLGEFVAGWSTDLGEAVEMEPAFLRGYAASRAKARAAAMARSDA